MVRLIKQLFCKFLYNCKSLSALIKKSLPEYPYRVLFIEQDKCECYVVTVQIKNKKDVFQMKPEEILANNNLTDSFSQRDIRMLTYLGYLGNGSPKYKILAKRLSEDDSKLFFAIKERGKTSSIIKTASEISLDQKFIAGLHQHDAHMIGYVTATEQAVNEAFQKKVLLETAE